MQETFIARGQVLNIVNIVKNRYGSYVVNAAGKLPNVQPREDGTYGITIPNKSTIDSLCLNNGVLVEIEGVQHPQTQFLSGIFAVTRVTDVPSTIAVRVEKRIYGEYLEDGKGNTITDSDGNPVQFLGTEPMRREAMEELGIPYSNFLSAEQAELIHAHLAGQEYFVYEMDGQAGGIQLSGSASEKALKIAIELSKQNQYKQEVEYVAPRTSTRSALASALNGVTPEKDETPETPEEKEPKASKAKGKGEKVDA